MPHHTINLSHDAFFCLEELIVDQYKFGNFDVIDEEAFWELVDSMPSVQYRLREMTDKILSQPP